MDVKAALVPGATNDEKANINVERSENSQL